jgi:hypothetical protein
MLQAHRFVARAFATVIVAAIVLPPDVAGAQIRGGVISKPAVTAAPPKIEVVKTDISSTVVSDGNSVSGLRGVLSSDSENPAGDRDTYMHVPSVQSQLIASVRLSSNTRRLKDDPDVQKYLDVAKLALNGFEIHTALLAGHKYMINDCLGIKVSAGEFLMKIPDPDLRVENTGLVLTFNISQIAMNAFMFRFRPDVTDPTEMCHFSGRQGVGATADNVRLEMPFDPILDLQQCKIGSMGHMTQVWRIGKLRMSPLPSAVSDLAGNIIEDALTYVSNFNIVDRLVAGFNGIAGAQCHA